MIKYFKKLLVLVVLLCPIGVLAAGNIAVSPTTLEVEVGSKKSFKISAYNSIGDVTLTTSNSDVATINTNSWSTGMVDEKQTKSTNITVTGKRIGDATITLSIDAATFDGEDLSNQKRTVKVKVVEKKQTPNDNKKITKSTNNKLKSISIGEYEIVKINSNYYEASVGNDVDKINLNVVAEDKKAKITGAGIKQLNAGENNFSIVITSESGTQNRINLKVIKEQTEILDNKTFVNEENNKIKDLIIYIESGVLGIALISIIIVALKKKKS